MPVNEYCSRGDLYLYGLPRGTLGMGGRLVDSFPAATSVSTLDGHGFENGDSLYFRAADGGTLPAPLVFGTVYYAIRLDDSRFQVSATLSNGAPGAPVTITADAVNTLVATPLPFDSIIEFYSRWVDTFMPAHVVPFVQGSVPSLVRGITAELAAKKLMQLAGHTADSMDKAELAAKAQLERFASGVPLRDASATPPANTAVQSQLVATGFDPRGWGSGVIP